MVAIHSAAQWLALISASFGMAGAGVLFGFSYSLYPTLGASWGTPGDTRTRSAHRSEKPPLRDRTKVRLWAPLRELRYANPIHIRALALKGGGNDKGDPCGAARSRGRRGSAPILDQ